MEKSMEEIRDEIRTIDNAITTIHEYQLEYDGKISIIERFAFSFFRKNIRGDRVYISHRNQDISLSEAELLIIKGFKEQLLKEYETEYGKLNDIILIEKENKNKSNNNNDGLETLTY